MHQEIFVLVMAIAVLFPPVCAASPHEALPILKRTLSQPNLAVYWGQGSGQKRLGDFCQDATIDIIPIGFVNIFPDQAGDNNGYPETNYGNACSGYWTTPNGTATKMFAHCDQIAVDVPLCQSRGKKIFASLGGAVPGDNLISSTASAQAFAQFLWGSFGPVQGTNTYPRPFGDSVVDGFDLDMETGPATNYADLVNELRRLFAQDASKTYYVSCVPQCVIPDAQMHDAIENSDIDYVFVQYYNTPFCSAESLFTSGVLRKRSAINGTVDVSQGWVRWLQQNSKNKGVKLYLGLPASTTAANPAHYLTPDQAQELITIFACDDTYQSMFGGVMLWEATHSDNNQIDGESYAAKIKDILGSVSCTGGSTPTVAVSSLSTVNPTSTTSISIGGGPGSETISPSTCIRTLPGSMSFSTAATSTISQSNYWASYSTMPTTALVSQVPC